MNVEEKYKELAIERRTLKKQLKNKKKRLKKVNKEVQAHEDATALLKKATTITYKQISLRIEKLVTQLLRAVYDRPFTFHLSFRETKKSVEAKPVIMEGDKVYNPEFDKGGGVIDVISFALRVASWSMKRPRTRNVLILDEPFKWMGDLLPLIGDMLKFISTKLNVQIILTSHEDYLIEICDRVYLMDHNGKETITTLVKGRKIKRRSK